MNWIFIESEVGIWKRIVYDDVIFIEYCNRNCLIHTQNDNLLFRNISLRSLLKKLSKSNFVLSNRSHAINLNHVKSIKSLCDNLWVISFYNTSLSVSLTKTYKSSIFTKLNIL